MSENHCRSACHHFAHVVDGTTVVELRGEIDIATASPIAARLDTVTAGPCPDLVLDLRAVSFIDCAGLSLLCRARNRVLARRGRLCLVTEDTRVLRVLRGAGLSGVFTTYPRLPGQAGGTPDRSDHALQ
ncbi:STAS domain-containing protein [Streptomyces sp. NBC_00414]|uniref:STAS domain-containing protein n=1 Tax=Streptomyces sp. NBC_00414 TaxID=2975739 RepID=UPI002E24D0EB